MVKIVSLVAFLAQSVERAALNRAVVGSRPTGGVLFFQARKVRRRKEKKEKKKAVKKQKRRFRMGSNHGPIG